MSATTKSSTPLMPLFCSYRSLNLCPIPVPLGKKAPLIKWAKYQDELPTVSECEAWDRQDTNIALLTGKISNVFVIDVDGDVGFATLNALTSKYGEFPKTPTVKTARGKHFYFCLPTQITIKNLAGRTPTGELLPGIDVRGEGGIATVPPSLHASGKRYEWLISPWECAFAECPQWLITLLVPRPIIQFISDTEPKGSSYALGALRKAVGNVSAAACGTRNDTLNRELWSMLRFVDTGDLDIHDLLFAMVGAGSSAGLAPKEIQTTICSALTSRKKMT